MNFTRIYLEKQVFELSNKVFVSGRIDEDPETYVSRLSEKITYLSQHTNISYRRMISSAIKEYKKNGVKVGFCGQQPSDSLEFTKFLIDEGIDSISVIPESAINTIHQLGKV